MPDHVRAVVRVAADAEAQPEEVRRAREALAREIGASWKNSSSFNGELATGMLGAVKVMLVKPMTFMNLSGNCVAPVVKYHNAKVAEDLLVVSDDIDLPVGRMRIRRGGSAGGHNGLKSIISCLGSDQFPRVKIGVGKKPRPDYDLAAWVLGKFTAEDQKAIDKACEDAVNAAACIIAEDCAAAAQKFNGKRI